MVNPSDISAFQLVNLHTVSANVLLGKGRILVYLVNLLVLNVCCGGLQDSNVLILCFIIEEVGVEYFVKGFAKIKYGSRVQELGSLLIHSHHASTSLLDFFFLFCKSQILQCHHGNLNF